MSKRIPSLCLFAVVCLSLNLTLSAQQLTSAAKATVDGAFDSTSAGGFQSLPGLAVKAPPDFLNDESDPLPASFVVSPGSLAGIQSVVNFSGSFERAGHVWPFTMMGNDPSLGHRTKIRTNIIAVSLELQNADLVTTTTVPIAPFEQLVLNSPNFRRANYDKGFNDGVQFGDAVQRAEFSSVMDNNWHTDLSPARIVNRVTIQVPRFVTVTLNGQPTQVRTYFTGKAADGSTFVLLLNRFFNTAFFNAFVDGINNNQFTTDSMNILLFPNTFLFSLSKTGGLGGCCTLGFHTFIFDNGTPTPIWVGAYASWISPGVFGAGFEDVTALSHEISEAMNDPFLNNATPRWQFPGEPGACQGNLETGDPVEVLANATVPVPIEIENEQTGVETIFTFHPQTEALLQWFDGAVPSDAFKGAYSYPDRTALTAPATLCQ